MLDPLGTSLRLTHGPFAAEVMTRGAVLRTFTRDGLDLVDGFAADEPCPDYRGWVLMPWPNRVADGRYELDGKPQQLPINEPDRGNALHGLVGTSEWNVAEHTRALLRLEHHLAAQPGYPGELDLAVRYELDDEGLHVTFDATNVGAGPAPYGCGHHPYLTVGRAIAQCELTLPAGSCCPMDERGHPGVPESVDGTPLDFRAARPIGDTVIDHPFTDLDRDSSGAVAVELRDPESGRSVRVLPNTRFPWVHAFTADLGGADARQSLAVEPMTCAPDAFNSGRGLLTLAPGESSTAGYLLTGATSSGPPL